jgi:hypothetical protein
MIVIFNPELFERNLRGIGIPPQESSFSFVQFLSEPFLKIFFT